jgi:hypothetical protein
VRWHGDFHAMRSAIAVAVQANITVNESGETLNRVPNGLNLPLNRCSPGRALALLVNWQTTRFFRVLA